ncbi:MAG: IgGFc-binding protein [Kofleriaceae bacterium]|nr:IgGFc-binding protein [Kofleriaceae bacterium]MCL4228753.1 hypothetical protein [Myxococcales bacterium]
MAKTSQICRAIVLAACAALTACGPSVSGDDDDTQGDGGTDGTVNQCTPGGSVCVGDEVHACNSDGTIGPLVATCAANSCSGGVCSDPCAAAEANRSYIGCEYWPVDLDNAVEVQGTELFPGFGCFNPSGGTSPAVTLSVCASGGTPSGVCDYGNDCSASPGTTCQSMPVCVLNATRAPFAVVVSNPQPTAVTVTLQNGSNQTAMDTVAPGQVKALFPQMMGLADQSLDHSGIERKAYKLTSSAPIVAYQFNPLDNVGVFSNDASLLIPRHAYDLAYTGVTYRTLTRRPATNDYNGYLTIVASAPGTTTVDVTVTAGVRAGLNVPALAAGASHQFTLQQYETLTLQAVAGADLTGTAITCGQPCGVFGGHEATNLSNQAQSPCCADHLEDQIFPNSTWGKVYVVARSQQRTTAVPDMVRVVAQRANTTVTFNPPQSGCSAPLGAGQFCDVFITGDVQVTGSEPILVAHYLLSNGGTQNDAGDPSMSFAVPTEQYRYQYALLVPGQYNNNYLSIVAPAGGTATLDGSPVTGFTSFGDGSFQVARVQVQAGAHNLICSEGCGVEVYGWSDAVSYLFAGGLDLEQIVIF